MNASATGKLIAGEVRAALARDGRSAASLAATTGITKSSLSRKLRGDRSFYVEEIVSIEDALDLTPGALIAPLLATAAA